MTIVAFGTSTPELVVNALSASQGSTALAFGNIAGSCSVNIGFVLAITALVQPLRVEPSLITREIPMMIVGVLAVLIFASDSFLDQSATNIWSRTDACALLLLFAIFLYYTTRQAIAAPKSDAFLEDVREESKKLSGKHIGRQVIFTILGLVGVSFGANWTVDYAVSLARLFGLSEAVIGLTIISLGTTLPGLPPACLPLVAGTPISRSGTWSAPTSSISFASAVSSAPSAPCPSRQAATRIYSSWPSCPSSFSPSPFAANAPSPVRKAPSCF